MNGLYPWIKDSLLKPMGHVWSVSHRDRKLRCRGGVSVEQTSRTFGEGWLGALLGDLLFFLRGWRVRRVFSVLAGYIMGEVCFWVGLLKMGWVCKVWCYWDVIEWWIYGEEKACCNKIQGLAQQLFLDKSQVCLYDLYDLQIIFKEMLYLNLST